MYLLDSNVIIDYLKGKNNTLDDILAENVYISIINFIEVSYGELKRPSMNNPIHTFSDFRKHAEIKTLPIDKKTAEIYLKVRLSLELKGQRLDDFDMLIAATALSNNLTLVTNNKKHFERIEGLQLL
jgi:tRNA(fMet)-specific endonuclease VapC